MNSVAGLQNVPQDKSLWDWLNELRDQPNMVNVYSQLKCSLELGQYATCHEHLPEGGPLEGRPDRDPPFCCGSPMRWAPDGWVCRVAGTVFSCPDGLS
ncbi:hypothetical protein [Dactylosporangium sp. CA-139066]|uniref:hypothetical protein n=1 Tax=Dactylosporangium sp. CA-139066 TaxID=3239930 RepID=UPI003D8C51F8